MLFRDRDFESCEIHNVNYGCILFIVPYNFPSIVLSERLPYAIAAGNCAVVKPSEITTGAIPEIIALVNRITGLDLAVLVEEEIQSYLPN